MNSSACKKRVAVAFVLCGCAMALMLPLCATEYSAGSLSGITDATRTVKTGSGTLTLSGNNSLVGLETKAGTLKINSGTTTIQGTGGAASSISTFGQSGGVTIVEGGATVNVWNTSGWGVATSCGDLMITNGTFQPVTYTPGSGKEFLHAISIPSDCTGCRLIVQDKGVFKWPQIRVCQTYKSELAGDLGIFLNAGGQMYVDKFYIAESGCYAVIRYNGGTVNITYAGSLYTGDDAKWANVKSYVDAGGFHLVNDVGTVTIDKPLFTGTGEDEPDGGVHFKTSGGTTIRLDGICRNSTFKGGTWFEGNMTFQNFAGSDGVFGKVPTSPTNNIFFKGNITMFGGNGGDYYLMHRNRNIAIDAGATITIGANRSFGIGGEINVPDGAECSTNTIVKFGSWSGRVVLDTGDGRTNRLDRVQVLKSLEIASGTTLVRSPTSGTGTGAPLYVEGDNSAYAGDAGNLKVSGGTLKIEGSRYAQASKYAQVLVSGGKVSMLDDYAEYLNGLSTPAKLTVENDGVFECYRIRVSQSSQSEINVNTGGVLRVGYFIMYGADTGTINLNGGTIKAYSSSAITETDRDNFLGGRSSTAYWANVTVRVLAGGARFDTDGNSRRVNTALVSGVGEGEMDGGLTKLGAGTLTLTGANGYNGPTRLEGGTLTFNSARPDGDIEFPAAALTACTNAATPLLWAKAIGSFRAGCGIRVTECDTLDSESWTGRWHTVARFSETDVDALPDITFVKSDGTVVSAENGWGGWRFRIGADGRRLEFKGTRGTMLKVR
ncbi:MAG: autotransporter-associated beta strand repeat-containing protein [Kiritimatiellae bacterium]|nr:autotransporter-associated beta strand repeat-containing protein [Kiritimatiellia bacterium]